jgi:hypothetical protein
VKIGGLVLDGEGQQLGDVHGQGSWISCKVSSNDYDDAA